MYITFLSFFFVKRVGLTMMDSSIIEGLSDILSVHRIEHRIESMETGELYILIEDSFIIYLHKNHRQRLMVQGGSTNSFFSIPFKNTLESLVHNFKLNKAMYRIGCGVYDIRLSYKGIDQVLHILNMIDSYTTSIRRIEHEYFII